MAGNRQQSRFIALVSNNAELTRAMNTANNSQDASLQQVLKTMNSIESKTRQLKNAFTDLYADKGLESATKGVLDYFTQVLKNIKKQGLGTILSIVSQIAGVSRGLKTAAMASTFNEEMNRRQAYENMAQQNNNPSSGGGGGGNASYNGAKAESASAAHVKTRAFGGGLGLGIGGGAIATAMFTAQTAIIQSQMVTLICGGLNFGGPNGPSGPGSGPRTPDPLAADIAQVGIRERFRYRPEQNPFEPRGPRPNNGGGATAREERKEDKKDEEPPKSPKTPPTPPPTTPPASAQQEVKHEEQPKTKIDETPKTPTPSPEDEAKAAALAQERARLEQEYNDALAKQTAAIQEEEKTHSKVATSQEELKAAKQAKIDEYKAKESEIKKQQKALGTADKLPEAQRLAQAEKALAKFEKDNANAHANDKLAPYIQAVQELKEAQAKYQDVKAKAAGEQTAIEEGPSNIDEQSEIARLKQRIANNQKWLQKVEEDKQNWAKQGVDVEQAYRGADRKRKADAITKAVKVFTDDENINGDYFNFEKDLSTEEDRGLANRNLQLSELYGKQAAALETAQTQNETPEEKRRRLEQANNLRAAEKDYQKRAQRGVGSTYTFGGRFEELYSRLTDTYYDDDSDFFTLLEKQFGKDKNFSSVKNNMLSSLEAYQSASANGASGEALQPLHDAVIQSIKDLNKMLGFGDTASLASLTDKVAAMEKGSSEDLSSSGLSKEQILDEEHRREWFAAGSAYNKKGKVEKQLAKDQAALEALEEKAAQEKQQGNSEELQQAQAELEAAQNKVAQLEGKGKGFANQYSQTLINEDEKRQALQAEVAQAKAAHDAASNELKQKSDALEAEKSSLEAARAKLNKNDYSGEAELAQQQKAIEASTQEWVAAGKARDDTADALAFAQQNLEDFEREHGVKSETENNETEVQLENPEIQTENTSVQADSVVLHADNAETEAKTSSKNVDNEEVSAVLGGKTKHDYLQYEHIKAKGAYAHLDTEKVLQGMDPKLLKNVVDNPNLSAKAKKQYAIYAKGSQEITDQLIDQVDKNGLTGSIKDTIVKGLTELQGIGSFSGVAKAGHPDWGTNLVNEHLDKIASRKGGAYGTQYLALNERQVIEQDYATERNAQGAGGWVPISSIEGTATHEKGHIFDKVMDEVADKIIAATENKKKKGTQITEKEEAQLAAAHEYQAFKQKARNLSPEAMTAGVSGYAASYITNLKKESGGKTGRDAAINEAMAEMFSENVVFDQEGVRPLAREFAGVVKKMTGLDLASLRLGYDVKTGTSTSFTEEEVKRLEEGMAGKRVGDSTTDFIGRVENLQSEPGKGFVANDTLKRTANDNVWNFQELSNYITARKSAQLGGTRELLQNWLTTNHDYSKGGMLTVENLEKLWEDYQALAPEDDSRSTSVERDQAIYTAMLRQNLGKMGNLTDKDLTAFGKTAPRSILVEHNANVSEREYQEQLKRQQHTALQFGVEANEIKATSRYQEAKRTDFARTPLPQQDKTRTDKANIKEQESTKDTSIKVSASDAETIQEQTNEAAERIEEAKAQLDDAVAENADALKENLEKQSDVQNKIDSVTMGDVTITAQNVTVNAAGNLTQPAVEVTPETPNAQTPIVEVNTDTNGGKAEQIAESLESFAQQNNVNMDQIDEAARQAFSSGALGQLIRYTVTAGANRGSAGAAPLDEHGNPITSTGAEQVVSTRFTTLEDFFKRIVNGTMKEDLTHFWGNNSRDLAGNITKGLGLTVDGVYARDESGRMAAVNARNVRFGATVATPAHNVGTYSGLERHRNPENYAGEDIAQHGLGREDHGNRVYNAMFHPGEQGRDRLLDYNNMNIAAFNRLLANVFNDQGVHYSGVNEALSSTLEEMDITIVPDQQPTPPTPIPPEEVQTEVETEPEQIIPTELTLETLYVTATTVTFPAVSAIIVQGAVTVVGRGGIGGTGVGGVGGLEIEVDTGAAARARAAQMNTPTSAPQQPPQKPKKSVGGINQNAHILASVMSSFTQFATFATTLGVLGKKENSHDDIEDSKVSSGVAQTAGGLASLGNAINAFSMGFMRGGLISGVASALPSIVASITPLFQGIKSWVDGMDYTIAERYLNSLEEVKEAEDEAIAARAKSKDLSSQIDSINELAASAYSSEEALSNYTGAMNNLADTYPQLVSAYDANGNAIVELTASEELLYNLRLKEAAANRDLAIAKLESNELAQNSITNAIDKYMEKIAFDAQLEELGTDSDMYKAYASALNVELDDRDLDPNTSAKKSAFYTQYEDLFTQVVAGQYMVNGKAMRDYLREDPNNAATFLKDYQQTFGQPLNYSVQNDYNTDRDRGRKLFSLWDANKDAFTKMGLLDPATKLGIDSDTFTSKKFNVTADQFKEYYEYYLTELKLLGESGTALIQSYGEAIAESELIDWGREGNKNKNVANIISTAREVQGMAWNALETNFATIANALSIDIKGATNVDELYKNVTTDEFTQIMEQATETMASAIYDYTQFMSDEQVKQFIADMGNMSQYGNVEQFFNAHHIANPSKDNDFYKTLEKEWEKERKNTLARGDKLIKGITANENGFSREQKGAIEARQRVFMSADNNLSIGYINDYYSELYAIQQLMDEGYTIMASTRLEKLNQVYDLLNGTGMTESVRGNYLTDLISMDYSSVASVQAVIDEINAARYDQSNYYTDQDRDALKSLEDQLINLRDSINENVISACEAWVTEIKAFEDTVGTIISDTSSGFNFSDAVESFEKLRQDSENASATFRDFFVFDKSLGKWTYTIQGLEAAQKKADKKIIASTRNAKKAYDTAKSIGQSDISELESYDNFDIKDINKIDSKKLSERIAPDANSQSVLQGWIQDYISLSAEAQAQTTLKEYIESRLALADEEYEAALIMYNKEILTTRFNYANSINWGAIMSGIHNVANDALVMELIRTTYLVSLEEAQMAVAKGFNRADYQKLIKDAGLADMVDIVGERGEQVKEISSQYSTAIGELLGGAGTILSNTTRALFNTATLKTFMDADGRVTKSADEMIKTAWDLIESTDAVFTTLSEQLESRKTVLTARYSRNNNILTSVSDSFDFDALNNLFLVAGKDLWEYFNVETGEWEKGLDQIFTTDIFGTIRFVDGIDINEMFKAFFKDDTQFELIENTSEYQKAYAEAINNILQTNNSLELEAITQLKEFAEIGIGQKGNLSRIKQQVSESQAFKDFQKNASEGASVSVDDFLAQYGLVITNGVATLTDKASANIGQLAKDLWGNNVSVEIDNALAELNDNLLKILTEYANILTNGLSGTMSNVDRNKLIAKHDNMKDDAYYTQTADGWKLTERGIVAATQAMASYSAVVRQTWIAELSNQRKNVEGWRSAIEINEKITQLRAKLADVDGQENSTKKEQYEAELRLAQEIYQVRSQTDADSFKFFEGNALNNGTQAALNAYESTYRILDKLDGIQGKEDGDTGTGGLLVSDYAELAMALESSGKLVEFAKKHNKDWTTAADMIREGNLATKRALDGSTDTIVDLGALFGADMASAISDMKDGATDFIHELATQQIAILEAEIRMLEGIAALEELDTNGTIGVQWGEFFDTSADGITSGAKAALDTLLADERNLDLLKKVALQIKGEETNLGTVLQDIANGDWKKYFDDSSDFESFFNSFIVPLTNIDWSASDITAQLAEAFKLSGLTFANGAWQVTLKVDADDAKNDEEEEKTSTELLIETNNKTTEAVKAVDVALKANTDAIQKATNAIDNHWVTKDNAQQSLKTAQETKTNAEATYNSAQEKLANLWAAGYSADSEQYKAAQAELDAAKKALDKAEAKLADSEQRFKDAGYDDPDDQGYDQAIIFTASLVYAEGSKEAFDEIGKLIGDGIVVDASGTISINGGQPLNYTITSSGVETTMSITGYDPITLGEGETFEQKVVNGLRGAGIIPGDGAKIDLSVGEGSVTMEGATGATIVFSFTATEGGLLYDTPLGTATTTEDAMAKIDQWAKEQGINFDEDDRFVVGAAVENEDGTKSVPITYNSGHYTLTASFKIADDSSILTAEQLASEQTKIDNFKTAVAGIQALEAQLTEIQNAIDSPDTPKEMGEILEEAKATLMTGLELTVDDKGIHTAEGETIADMNSFIAEKTQPSQNALAGLQVYSKAKNFFSRIFKLDPEVDLTEEFEVHAGLTIQIVDDGVLINSTKYGWDNYEAGIRSEMEKAGLVLRKGQVFDENEVPKTAKLPAQEQDAAAARAEQEARDEELRQLEEAEEEKERKEFKQDLLEKKLAEQKAAKEAAARAEQEEAARAAAKKAEADTEEYARQQTAIKAGEAVAAREAAEKAAIDKTYETSTSGLGYYPLPFSRDAEFTVEHDNFFTGVSDKTDAKFILGATGFSSKYKSAVSALMDAAPTHRDDYIAAANYMSTVYAPAFGGVSYKQAVGQASNGNYTALINGLLASLTETGKQIFWDSEKDVKGKQNDSEKWDASVFTSLLEFLENNNGNTDYVYTQNDLNSRNALQSTITGLQSVLDSNDINLTAPMKEAIETVIAGSQELADSGTLTKVSVDDFNAAVDTIKNSGVNTLEIAISTVSSALGNISSTFNNFSFDANSCKITATSVVVNGGGGSSSAKGNVALAQGNALAKGTLMGELGPEMVVANGRYFIAGQNGAEFVDLPSDAIVFNHLQTASLMSQGHSGRGKAVNGDAAAVAMATGNWSGGPAKASARETINTLQGIIGVWQSLLRQGAADLAKKSASGGGGGGGGGGGEDKSVLHDLDRWYNLLRQIAKLEAQISLEQKKRANMNSGYSHIDSLEKELEILEKMQKNYKQLSALQKSYYDEKRKEQAQSAYGMFFTYDEDGLMQYRDENYHILEELNKVDVNQKGEYNAKQQIAILKKYGFDTSVLDTNADGTKAKDDAAKMENFWTSFDNWIDELDSTYDSYHDYLEKIEDNQQEQIKIFEEFRQIQIDTENKLVQAIEDREQSYIDALQEEYDALRDAADKYTSGLTDALNKERQMYEQSENAKNLTQLQRQLAILQRSGGSASAIKSLQDQIDSQLQDQYFTERQNEIDAIKEASDAQLEKMQTQIDLMTESLEYQKEHGLLWNEVNSMMHNWDATKMADFIAQWSKEYESMSATQRQQEMLGNLKTIESWVEYLAHHGSFDDWYTANSSDIKGRMIQLGATSAQVDGAANEARLRAVAQEAYEKAIRSGKSNSDAQDAAEAAIKNYLGLNSAVYNPGEFVENKVQENDEDDGTNNNNDKPPKITYSGDYDNDNDGGGSSQQKQEGSRLLREIAEIQAQLNAGPPRKADEFSTNEAYNEYCDQWRKSLEKGIAMRQSLYDHIPHFSSGGNVNYTGLAMVHGTPSKPEAFLSADDRALMKSSIFSNKAKTVVAAMEQFSKFAEGLSTKYDRDATTSTGLNIENVSINLDSGLISDDYDARRAAQTVMDEIVKIARQTNNLGLSRR